MTEKSHFHAGISPIADDAGREAAGPALSREPAAASNGDLTDPGICYNILIEDAGQI
jgi:hypothetical protein